MASTPPTPSSEAASSPAPSSSAADQARLRKERREAKIKAGGSARLNRITGLGGGVQRDVPPAASPSPAPANEVSEHFYSPDTTPRNVFSGSISANFSYRPSGAAAPNAANAAIGGSDDMGEDPMMKMLQQMMGGGGSSFPGMPGGGFPPTGQFPGAANATTSPSTDIWRIMHAIFALSLGLYIALTTSFLGTKFERDMSATATYTAEDGTMGLRQGSVKFFYMFATIETVLQTSRFLLAKESPPKNAMVGMVLGVLPQPYKGYVELVMRYARIWTTVSADAMVCVFVLGVTSWLRAQ